MQDEYESPSESRVHAVRASVEREKNRLWDTQPESKQADTELGRGIQKNRGRASVVANNAGESWRAAISRTVLRFRIIEFPHPLPDHLSDLGQFASDCTSRFVELY